MLGFDANPDEAAAEPNHDLEARPRRRQARVHGQLPANHRSDPGVAEDERLPDRTEIGHVQPAARGVREIVEVNAGRQVERLERVGVITGTGKERGEDAGRQ